MSLKLLFGIALVTMSIGSAYALSTVHNITNQQPDRVFLAIEPTEKQQIPDTFPNSRPLEKEAEVVPARKIIPITPKTEVLTRLNTQIFPVQRPSPRPLSRVLTPKSGEGDTAEPLAMSEQRYSQIYQLWAVGVFR